MADPFCRVRSGAFGPRRTLEVPEGATLRTSDACAPKAGQIVIVNVITAIDASLSFSLLCLYRLTLIHDAISPCGACSESRRTFPLSHSPTSHFFSYIAEKRTGHSSGRGAWNCVKDMYRSSIPVPGHHPSDLPAKQTPLE